MGARHPWSSTMSQDNASSSVYPGSSVLCEGDSAVPGTGNGGTPAPEGASPGFLRSPSCVRSGDSEGDPGGMRSGTCPGENRCDVQVGPGDGTPDDTLRLQSPDDEEDTGSQHTGPGLSPLRQDDLPPLSPPEQEGSTSPPLSPIVLRQPLIRQGKQECIMEVRAFVQGGRPGLERLRLVLWGIFDTFMIRQHKQQSEILEMCGLSPVNVQVRVSDTTVVDRVSFLIPLDCQSPEWTRSVRSRKDHWCPAPSLPALVSPP